MEVFELLRFTCEDEDLLELELLRFTWEDVFFVEDPLPLRLTCAKDSEGAAANAMARIAAETVLIKYRFIIV